MSGQRMRPLMAILCQDTLAVMGLRQMLQSVMPAIEVESFDSVEQLKLAGEENYVHFFVYVGILLSNRPFFLERRKKTIVLTTLDEQASQMSDFRCLRITLPEEQLVKAFIALEQSAHPNGHHMNELPTQKASSSPKKLSTRELDVLRLIVKGYINKEIADKLNISLPTVITHRKKIMEKLAAKSVSTLTIYAVMNGYVGIEEI